MQKNRKKRKGKKIVAILMVIVILLLAAGVIFLAMRQVKQLEKEITKIIQLDEMTDSIDEQIYASGNYGEIEQVIKTYMGEYVENLKVIKTLFQDQEFADLLSVKNIQEDGPKFEKSLEYLEEKAESAKQAFQKLEDMAEEEMIMAAIEEEGLGSYFEGIYKRLMLKRVRVDYMYSAEGLKVAKEDVEQAISGRKAILVFLSENADDWRLEDQKLKFGSDDLLDQYNKLVDDMNRE